MLDARTTHGHAKYAQRSSLACMIAKGIVNRMRTRTPSGIRTQQTVLRLQTCHGGAQCVWTEQLPPRSARWRGGRRIPEEHHREQPRLKDPPPAAVLQDRPSAASAGTWRYSVSLDNVTFNGLPIQDAVLVVSIPCAGEPPPDATYVMKDAVICGNIQPANGLTAHGPPPFFPLSQVRTGDLVFGDPSSLRRPMAQSGLASATFAASAQAPPWQSTNGRHLPGMTAMITNRPQPGMAHPEPPQPRPIEGAHAGAPRKSAADVRADGWRGRRRRENDGTPDSSDA